MHSIPSARFASVLLALACVLLTSCATEPTASPSKPAGETRLPEVIRRVPPKYPYELNRKGITGTATVEFVITPRGDVANAKAVEATDPQFGEAAVEAVSQWKFKPGLKDGRPVASLNRQELAFNLADDQVPGPVSGTLQDIPPQAIHRVTPLYPIALNQRGVRGAAMIEFTVTTAGDVVDAKVVAATHPAFGQAALECIRQWKFKSAMVNGRPMNARIRQELTFNIAN